jgi:hypothetical protein
VGVGVGVEVDVLVGVIVGVFVGSGVGVEVALGVNVGLGVLVAAATFSAAAVGVSSAGGLPPQALSQSNPTANTITVTAGEYRPDNLNIKLCVIGCSSTIILIFHPPLR